MATPIVKKFNSYTWQFSGGNPSELFLAASKELAAPGITSWLNGTDISRNPTTGAYVLTLYFGTEPNPMKEVNPE